jgi:hypothetical protein
LPDERRHRSQTFRAQHRELLALIDDLCKQLDVEQLEANATRARTLLAMLAGGLGVHLAMEDTAFYARLLQHKNASVRKLAAGFVVDMNALRAAFDAYVARWPGAQAIQADAPQFVLETQQIVEALTLRIQREHESLFPALDES